MAGALLQPGYHSRRHKRVGGGHMSPRTAAPIGNRPAPVTTCCAKGPGLRTGARIRSPTVAAAAADRHPAARRRIAVSRPAGAAVSAAPVLTPGAVGGAHDEETAQATKERGPPGRRSKGDDVILLGRHGSVRQRSLPPSRSINPRNAAYGFCITWCTACSSRL